MMNSIATLKLTEHHFYHKLPQLFLMLGVFSMMFSTPWMNKLFALSIFFILLDKSNWGNLRAIKSHQVVIASVMLLVLFTAGIFYSQGSWYEAYRVWDKYLKIAYVVIFLSLFSDSKWKNYLIYTLIVAVLINELMSYLHYYHVINFNIPDEKHWLFVQDIDASFILAFVCFLLINFMLDHSQYRWIYFLAFLCCFYDLFFLNQERTGYLVFTSLISFMLWQRMGRKGLLVMCLLIPIGLTSLYTVSVPFNTRVTQLFNDIETYSQGIKTTPIGYRLTFAACSFSIIKQNPFFGAGTGSFIKLYQDFNGPKLPGNTTAGHPHNEYLFIFLQLGIVGFCTFLYWLYAQYQQTKHLCLSDQRLARGLLLAFLVLSFCNCSLYVSPAGILFVILMGAFLSADVASNCHSCLRTLVSGKNL